MEDDDAALLAGIRDGSQQAFNRFVDRHQKSLRSFLRGVVRLADADDVAQEAFLVVWSKADSYRGGASVRSWLFAIAWKKAKDLQRSGFRRRQREVINQDVLYSGTGSNPAPDQLAIWQALELLSLDERAAVLLCLAGGFSHSEAGAALGVPLGTLKSQVARGRERLRAVLEDETNG